MSESLQLSSYSGFEGPEKKLEIDFKQVNDDGSTTWAQYPAPPSDKSQGLRGISIEKWRKLCSLVNCMILSSTSNEHFDSYVLSESSLFVYPQKFVMKTCGTTTLLACLECILEYGEECGLEVECCFYSRQKFIFPEKQRAPHTSFGAEVAFLNTHFVDGQGYALGEQTGDHWFLYHVDHSLGKPTVLRQDRTIELMMEDLDADVMKLFHLASHGPAPAATVDTDPRIEVARTAIRSLLPFDELFPGLLVDDHVFEPCGYSVNGLHNGAYMTVHVTPELAHSFVSFETNCTNLDPLLLLEWVTKRLKPGRVSLSVFADTAVGEGADARRILPIKVPGYRRRGRTHLELFPPRGHEDHSPYDVLFTTLVRAR
eukprot:CAMPEP_0168592732 /NCGR_PEP_ID=MMETSP0420-20121227/7902_1 /TAXON_ID=498008 /ORGANISM="Pessonella sp." /LENGTH=370 /DNA_ID=CAMNT_0008628765 /DNA_START=257 /DNA_END=1366 /DNA_ORIENTATION=-